MDNSRIYADFNGLCDSNRTCGRLAVPLDTKGSIRDLSNAGLRLREGATLLIYDGSDEDEDLKAWAIAYYESSRGRSLAELSASGYENVPKQDRNLIRQFRCVGCRADLEVDMHGFPREAECSHCRTSTRAAIAPPAGMQT